MSALIDHVKEWVNYSLEHTDLQIFYEDETIKAGTGKRVYVKLIEPPYVNNQVCAGLYDEQGIRCYDYCCVIWDKRRPDKWDQGYAPGRCTDVIPS